MSTLSARQQAFAAALVGPAAADAAAPVAAAMPDEQDARELAARLAVYRRSLDASERRALQLAFPVVAALVGEAFFAALARAYVDASPSTSGDLQARGATLADFLDGWTPAQPLPYLADVARLEWLVHRARIAADAAPIAPARIAAMAPSALLALRVGLPAACAWLTSPHPVASIWRWQQAGDAAPALEAHAHTALVLRRGWTVDVVAAAPGDIAALAALRAGARFGDAIVAAQAADAAFAPGAAIVRWLDWQVLTEPDES